MSKNKNENMNTKEQKLRHIIREELKRQLNEGKSLTTNILMKHYKLLQQLLDELEKNIGNHDYAYGDLMDDLGNIISSIDFQDKFMNKVL
jgi:hypothetical protein